MKQFCRLAKAHTFLSCLVLAAVLLVSVIAGIGFGPVSIPFSQVWQVMLHRLGGLLTGSALPLENRLFRLATIRQSLSVPGSRAPSRP